MYDSPAVYWDWAVGLYLFFGALAGGAYVTGAVADYLRYRTPPAVGSGGRVSAALTKVVTADGYAPIARAGLAVSVLATVAVGGVLLFLHLGQPLAALALWRFTNTDSWMAIGVWIITAFVVVLLLQVGSIGYREMGLRTGRPIDRIADQTLPGTRTRIAVHVVGVGLAVALLTYTAVLLGVVQPVVPMWHPTLLPVLFVISGLSTGISGTLLATVLFRSDAETSVHRFSLADDVLLVGELIVIGALLVWLANAGGVARQSYEILTEAFVLEFWMLVVGGGILVPLVLSLVLAVGDRAAVQLPTTWTRALYTAKFGLVLTGGLFLRLALLYAAVNVPLL